MQQFTTFCRNLTLFVALFCFLTTEAFAAPLIRDAEIEHTLRVYGDPIFTAAGVNPSRVKIFIIEDDSINSFVAGGPNIFVNTGLIERCDTPDMLIGVMAHETGHIAGGHLAQGTEQLKNAEMGTILSYILGAAAAVASHNGGAAAAVIGGGTNTIGRSFLAFTRAHEEAADQSALNSLDKVGMSASGLMKVFALLQRDARNHPGSPDPYLLTHPLTEDRIEHVRNHVETSSIPEGTYPKSYDIMQKRMVAKLYGFLESPERTMQKYPLSDKSVPARMARAIAYYQMPDLDRSMKEMDSLIAESPNDPFFHELKGQILFENRHAPEALTEYQKSVSLLPDSPLILTDMGKVELAQSPPQTTSAIAHLEKANTLDNANADTWRLLATAYGKANNMGMSYLALAEEASLEGDSKSALINANQALTLLKEGTPARQRAQDVKAHAIEDRASAKKDASPF